MTGSIIAYKGFDAQMRCQNFQFEVGKTFEHDGDVEACKSGFHGCEYPLDVFSYYPPAGSRFAVVEQSGKLLRHDGDSKVASERIHIRASIDLAGLTKAAVDYTTSHAKPIDPDSPASATSPRGAASATGSQGAASATGDRGAASATGDHGVAMAAGWQSRALASFTGAIFLVERDDDGSILHIFASKVGENGVKPDTWYMLRDGALTEVWD